MYIPKITYYILSVATAFALASGLTSCAENDDELIPEKENARYQVSLTVNLGDASTRAITETDEPGTGFENYIDMNNFHVYIMDVRSSWSSQFIDYDHKEIEWDFKYEVSSGVWYMVGYFPESDKFPPSDKFKLVAIANWDQEPCYEASASLAWLYIDNKTRYVYTKNYTDDDGISYYRPSKDNPIPMYGIHTIDKKTFLKGQCTDLGKIDMLRAMAKVEVVAADEDTKITNVKMNKYMDSGMSAPRNMWENTVTDPTNVYQNLPGDNTTRCTAANTMSDLPFYTEDNVHYVVYVPEFRLNTFTCSTTTDSFGEKFHDTLRPAEDNYITVTTSSGEFPIYFQEYLDGAPKANTTFNILRNHHYKYNVKILPGERLSIDYMVLDWNEETAETIVFE